MVTYAKGAPRPTAVDAGWPHQVEIEVPWNGLGRRLGDITRWVQAHAPPPASAKRSGGHRDAIRWCFVDRGLASAFQARFGGTLLEAERPLRRRR